MAYKHAQDHFFATSDYCRIYWQKWIPAEPIRLVLIIQHGLGEHGGRYQNLLDAMMGCGIAFYALDSRGHGKSEGIRGHVQPFGQYAEDLHQLIQIAKREQQVEHVFLLGHSLGAVVAADYALRYQEELSGLLLSSTGVLPHMNGYLTVMKQLTSVLNKIVPDLSVGSNLKLKFLSHDAQVIADYKADPLTHGKITPSLGHALFNIHEEHFAKASRLNVPLFVFHGTGDKITDPKGSERFYQLAGSQDKTLKLYEGLYHETLNEIPISKAEVIQDIRDWLEKRAPKP